MALACCQLLLIVVITTTVAKNVQAQGIISSLTSSLGSAARTATSTGDPILTGFDGRAFEFIGEDGAYYNVLSEIQHQVSTKLKLGQMWDHNGTYMEGIGFRYQDHKVIVELGAHDNMHVYLDGKRLTMAIGENEQEHIMGLESGEMMLRWRLHRPDIGQAVEITTDLLYIVIFMTPAVMSDKGGVLQPAYLNFDAALLGPPARGLKGIIGIGYERLAAGVMLSAIDSFRFHGVESEYKMDGYFSTAHPHNAFGDGAGAAGTAGGAAHRLPERALLAFPLRCRGGGVPSDLSTFPPEPRRRRLVEAVTLRRRMLL